MIVVTVQLVRGRELQVLGRAIIENDGTSHDERRGDYNVKIGHRAESKRAIEIPECIDGAGLRRILERPVRTGRVKGFPRRSYSVWRLVIKALRAAFPEEK